jgi:hypothetical protein
MEDNLHALLRIATNLLEIPANEQHIGHLQVAMKEALLAIHSELAWHRKALED